MAEIPGWVSVEIGNLVMPQSGARPYGGATLDSGEIPSLGGENIKMSGGVIYEPVKKVPEHYFHQMKKGILQDTDVLINKDGANTGKVGLYSATNYQVACVNEHVFILRADKNSLTQEFLYYLLLSDIGQKKIKDKISGSAQPGLGSPFLKDFVTQIPASLAEQRQIVDILSTLDETIVQSEALVRKYQSIKQGLMSDLLMHKKNWLQMQLGAACAKGGGSIQTGPFGSQLHSRDYKEEGIPIITVEHLGDNEIIHSNLPLVGAEDYKRLERYKIVEGDLVFSRVGAIDRCAYVSVRENNWLFSGRCLRVRPGAKFDAKFLSYQLNGYSCRQWILNNAVGSTMKCLNTTILSGLPVSIPKIEEQEEIALVLTEMDKTIKAEESGLSKLALLKQGLMQDLLTGKVRVDYE